MKKVISIGIDNAKGLTPLSAAVSGAKEFTAWAKSQGYETVLFTDENAKPVTQNAIFDEIQHCVESKKYELVIIFFSGHGLLKSPSQETWLLSNASSNPNESINLTGSIDYARTCGIPYIVFISDACRVLPAEIQLTGNGSIIFPAMKDTNQDCAIDVFYATRPGSPANEVSSIESSKKFGLFTECLIDVLSGKYPDLLWSKGAPGGCLTSFYDVGKLKENKKYKGLPGTNKWELYSIGLDPSLKSIVSERANAISITINQSPDLRIQYQKKQPYLSIFEDDAAKDLMIGNNTKTQVSRVSDDNLHERIQERLSAGLISDGGDQSTFEAMLKGGESSSYLELRGLFKLNVEEPRSFYSPAANSFNTDTELIKNSEKIFQSKGRDSFETGTGFTVIGDQILDVIVKDNQREIFTENNATQVKIFENSSISSALFILYNGQSIPVAVLKGYIGTLVFDKERLLTINYTPSRHNYKYNDYVRREKEISFVRAYIASAANEGFDYQKTFAREFDKNGEFNYNDAGGFLRREKSFDPSLGLYAAYAYMQAGLFKDIKSVYRYMRLEEDAIPFDVAMLANRFSDTDRIIAPFCPMLSLGWAYRNRFDKEIPYSIHAASEYLLPNLWTTFDRRGTDILTTAMHNNELL